jgi:hypothetical protein
MRQLQHGYKGRSKAVSGRAPRRMLPALALAAGMLAAPGLAHACAACGCTLSGDWGVLGAPGAPGFIADVSYNYLNQDRQRYGTGAASPALISQQLNAGQEVEAYTRTQTVTATLMYSDDTWGAAVVVPYLKRDHGTYGSTAPLGSGYSTSTDSSMGDMRVIGHYMGWSADRSSGIIAGMKFPTGSTGASFNAGASTGTALDSSLQIGTGSTDVILGGYVSGVAGNHGWFVQGTVQHAVATHNNYRPGDTISLNASVRYGAYGARVSPMLQLNVINRQADTGANATPADPVTQGPSTGGTLVYLSPGGQVRLGEGLSMYGFVQVPVFEKVNSLQLTPRYTLTVGARRMF